MSNQHQIFLPKQIARKTLANKLHLPFSDDMQDWEYEISDPKKLADFFAEYEKAETSNDERAALMEMILDSLEELLLLHNNNNKSFMQYFDTALVLLKTNKLLHQGTLNYWIEGDAFNISKLLKASIHI